MITIVRTTRSQYSGGGPVKITQWFTDTAMAPPAPGAILGAAPNTAAVGNVVMEDRLIEAPQMMRELSSDLLSLGGGGGAGTLVLSNFDGGLNDVVTPIWNDVKVWLWDDALPLTSALFLFGADCGRAEYLPATARPARIAIPLIDAMTRLDRPLLGTLYAGTNNGTSILYEGEKGGIAGRPKPVAIGDLNSATSGPNCPSAHVPAVSVNGYTRTFQLYDGLGTLGGMEVFDRGGPAGLAYDGNLSGPAFDARILPAASYCTDFGRGLIKITDGLIGPISFGCRGEAQYPDPVGAVGSAPGRCLAELFLVANQSGGVRAIPFDATALGLAMPIGPCGWWFDSAVSVREAASLFARAGGAALASKRDGKVMAVAMAYPSGPAALSLVESDLVSITTPDTSPVPVGEVRVGWGHIWTTFEGQDLVPSLRSTPDAERLRGEWRFAVAGGPTSVSASRSPDWRSVTLETALRCEAAAQAVADRLLLAFSQVGQRMWTVGVMVSAETLAVELGAIIYVDAPSARLSRNLLLVGEKLGGARADVMEWTLWG